MLVSSISKGILSRLADVQAAFSSQPTLFCSARAISNGLPANQLPFLAADKGQHFPRAGKLFLIRADDPQIGFACIGVDTGLLGFQQIGRESCRESVGQSV